MGGGKAGEVEGGGVKSIALPKDEISRNRKWKLNVNT